MAQKLSFVRFPLGQRSGRRERRFHDGEKLMRIARLWPVVGGLVLVMFFGALETRGFASSTAVRSSFTLVGLVDCGLRNGRTCSLDKTLVLVSDDSGAKVPYTIDLSWVKDDLPGDLEQDQQVRIEIERLPDGTLMALRVNDLNDRNGTRRDDEGPRPSSSDQQEEDDDFTAQGSEETTTTTATGITTICLPATVTSTARTTTTGTETTGSTLTDTTTTTTTSTATTTTTSSIVVTTTTTSLGPGAVTTETTSSTTTLSPCGTVTTATTAIDSTTVTSTSDTTTTETSTVTQPSTVTQTEYTTSTTTTTTTNLCVCASDDEAAEIAVAVDSSGAIAGWVSRLLGNGATIVGLFGSGASRGQAA
jgi:hypothetical protein